MTFPREAADCVTEWLGPGCTVRPLTGDASVRAYYRVTTPSGETFMLTYYPAAVRHEVARVLGAYESVASYLPVPEVLQHSELAMLQRDVGDRTLYGVLHQDRQEGVRLYRQAIDLLVAFQKAPDRGVNAPFTAELFIAELEMTRRFYVDKLMGFDGEASRSMMENIADKITHHAYVLCHRDYHGQNIHVVNDSIFVIDYQDLRRGPDTYDLASLLRDRGVARILGDATELDLVAYYADRAAATGDVRRRYFETLLQRSLKILGTFSRQPIVRGRMHYLDFIPPTLESVQRCVDELPEYGALRDIFPLAFDLEAARERARQLNEEKLE